MITAAANSFVCDPVVPLTNFDVAKFAGTWYEQQHTKDPQEPSKYQCSTAQYTDLTDDADVAGMKDFKVYNSFQSKVLGLWTPRIGVHAKAKCGTDGGCYVSFFGHAVPEPNLHVLETDYTSYAINYWCDTDQQLVHLWINTREPTVSEEFFSEIYAKAMKLAPSFDEGTLDPRLTQGDMCSYKKLDNKGYSVASFLAAFGM
mmetsp:Transcript_31372/g.41555  ORF Transcript_31372/g.41555 Transcript_31372/m.41555 type:complete len:202 (-) Transcript_31372:118-723(-)|eukprot:CAMPEP_0185584838 /NCGR_PEP_ID=MMETSP0434-20130131/34772_1 /TAXON_ID=626734 ORGANISM="Favella taraikaensis, Strain Fe Narragansett Bay" /NCGR_SAMPLE_ID=MMETSP0434 /ASSEMBLY_ACC=CAM_ASM_000379 /LENGTH=201 /DNA_ID=CAMNT_0028204849 /DNA_START=32 /DNA_END=637 /DNA_ORIENTATION=-